MGYFEKICSYEHEQVVLCHDKASGLKAVIAVHNTVLGPALGGCRMWPFESEEEAVEDALRLSRGMTYKNAAAGLNIGGGKAVIIGDPRSDKSEALFRAFGQYVQSLNGRYISAEDVGTCVEDMKYIQMETSFVTGTPEEEGGSGDPSPYTALGTFEGIKAAAKYKLGSSDLNGVTVAVQGTGHVGYYLCEYLHDAGAKLILTDKFPEKAEDVAQKFGGRTVSTDEIYSVDAEIFAPCALGAIVNDTTLDSMKFKIIAGAANNQLLDEKRHSLALKEKGILYVPDYIINAGGVINVYFEAIKDYNQAKVTSQVKAIYNTVEGVLKTADNENITTLEAAAHIAEKRIEQIGNVRMKYTRRN